MKIKFGNVMNHFSVYHKTKNATNVQKVKKRDGIAAVCRPAFHNVMLRTTYQVFKLRTTAQVESSICKL